METVPPRPLTCDLLINEQRMSLLSATILCSALTAAVVSRCRPFPVFYMGTAEKTGKGRQRETTAAVYQIR